MLPRGAEILQSLTGLVDSRREVSASGLLLGLEAKVMNYIGHRDVGF